MGHIISHQVMNYSNRFYKLKEKNAFKSGIYKAVKRYSEDISKIEDSLEKVKNELERLGFKVEGAFVDNDAINSLINKITRSFFYF